MRELTLVRKLASCGQSQSANGMIKYTKDKKKEKLFIPVDKTDRSLFRNKENKMAKTGSMVSELENQVSSLKVRRALSHGYRRGLNRGIRSGVGFGAKRGLAVGKKRGRVQGALAGTAAGVGVGAGGALLIRKLLTRGK